MMSNRYDIAAALNTLERVSSFSILIRKVSHVTFLHGMTTNRIYLILKIMKLYCRQLFSPNGFFLFSPNRFFRKISPATILHRTIGISHEILFIQESFYSHMFFLDDSLSNAFILNVTGAEGHLGVTCTLRSSLG